MTNPSEAPADIRTEARQLSARYSELCGQHAELCNQIASIADAVLTQLEHATALQAAIDKCNCHAASIAAKLDAATPAMAQLAVPVAQRAAALNARLAKCGWTPAVVRCEEVADVPSGAA